jgi:tetraacyldisaccharide 4'-kinase
MLPLVPVYLAGAALRWAGVKPKRLAWPVVSVGNLSAGGTGKTPFTIALARLLLAQGISVDVLSRGYGRAESRAEQVDPEGSAEQFGDEPLLIARDTGVPVFVGARRFEAGVLAEDEKTAAGPSIAFGANSAPNSAQDDKDFYGELGGFGRVHLLDDGFQHRQLFRDVDIVMVNSEDLADRVLPAGNLREPLSALSRASVFAVPVGDNAAVERLRELGYLQPVWRFLRELTTPEVAGPVVAFCGIARPQQFFAGLEAAGMAVAGRQVFPDHHPFGANDIETLRRLVRETGAVALVTTDKDRVRLGCKGADLGIPLVTATLRVVIEDETAVLDWLRNRLEL